MSERSEAAVSIAVSPGELLDRITILRIKADRLTDPEARARANAQLGTCNEASRSLRISDTVNELSTQLHEINQALWDTENEVRRHEREQDFSSSFVEHARSIYRLNDRRAHIKKCIDEELGSSLTEEKSYDSSPS